MMNKNWTESAANAMRTLVGVIVGSLITTNKPDKERRKQEPRNLEISFGKYQVSRITVRWFEILIAFGITVVIPKGIAITYGLEIVLEKIRVLYELILLGIEELKRVCIEIINAIYQVLKLIITEIMKWTTELIRIIKEMVGDAISIICKSIMFCKESTEKMIKSGVDMIMNAISTAVKLGKDIGEGIKKAIETTQNSILKIFEKIKDILIGLFRINTRKEPKESDLKDTEEWMDKTYARTAANEEIKRAHKEERRNRRRSAPIGRYQQTEIREHLWKEFEAAEKAAEIRRKQEKLMEEESRIRKQNEEREAEEQYKREIIKKQFEERWRKRPNMVRRTSEGDIDNIPKIHSPRRSSEEQPTFYEKGMELLASLRGRRIQRTRSQSRYIGRGSRGTSRERE
jgi:hypothetical protein